MNSEITFLTLLLQYVSFQLQCVALLVNMCMLTRVCVFMRIVVFIFVRIVVIAFIK